MRNARAIRVLVVAIVVMYDMSMIYIIVCRGVPFVPTVCCRCGSLRSCCC